MKSIIFNCIVIVLILISNVSAIDWCEDLEVYKKKRPVDYEINPLAAPDKCIKRDTIHKKKFALFPIANQPDKCNFWVNATKPMLVAPWPKNCMIYQHDNVCMEYEISRDGKSIDSCEIKKKCKKKKMKPICL